MHVLVNLFIFLSVSVLLQNRAAKIQIILQVVILQNAAKVAHFRHMALVWV